MNLRGHTTTFQTRLEISEHAAAGLNDTRITERVGCSIWTVRTWRRRSMHQGRVGFKSPMGRPAAGPLSTFPKKLKETILHLRKLHPGWGPNTLLAALKMDVYWGNQPLPSRALSHQAPLEAYPHAIHSGRMYRPEWEEDLLCLENVWTYLGACRWFRRIRTNGFFCLGGSSYYVGKHVVHLGVAIRFNADPLAFLCQLEGSEEVVQVPTQGLTKADLMGELALMQTLPTYQ